MIDAPEKRLAQLDGLWKHGEDVVVLSVSMMPTRLDVVFSKRGRRRFVTVAVVGWFA
jgi:hypothetical protein